jgi:uncharacterized membrane protein YsdA (DUF1294 family)
MTKLLAVLAAVWRIISHRITIWALLIGSCFALGCILARAYFQHGPIEQHTSGAGICLTVIAVAFVIGYIKDSINELNESDGEQS